MLLDKVIKYFGKECLLNKTEPIIVGVSGGADSLCLLDLLSKAGYQLIIAHFNHGIREESIVEAVYVENIGLSKGIKVFQGASSVPEHAHSQSLSLEESARILRYKFLFDQAIKFDAQAVAVAHNADDQVETILMHLLRGTGLNGLTGMTFHELPNPWNQDIPLVRPLLKISRKEIDFYCIKNNIEPVLDRTNLDIRYLRNYLRHQIIPRMEELSPGFGDRIGRMVELLKADQEVLEKLTEKVWRSILLEQGVDFICIKVRSLKEHPIGLQRRLIRRGIKEITKNLTDIDYDIVDRIRVAAYRQVSGQEVDVGHGLKALIEGQRLFIAYWESKLPTHFWPQIGHEIKVPIGEVIQLGRKWKFEIKWVEDIGQAITAALKNQDPNVVWLDPREQIKTLTIRNRQPGDRFQPLGMAGQSMKISDYMINQKIPKRARKHWPLICINEKIAWIVGKQLGESFRLSKNTRRVIKFTIYSE